MSQHRLLFACTIIAACFYCCRPANMQDRNPPAPGFDIKGSDHHAIIIADEVMEAMGGRVAWDSTRYLRWNFFGQRLYTWDKQTGDLRIESLPDSMIYLLNLHTMQGKVNSAGWVEVAPDSLARLLQSAKDLWIKDSYWLLMPFKLKDTGVTLKYQGQETQPDGRIAYVLQLTINNVVKPPSDKYLIFVDKHTKLVVQWAFFKNADQMEPDFTTPWAGYQRYGRILLSGDRGERRITDIQAPEVLPNGIFESFVD